MNLVTVERSMPRRRPPGARPRPLDPGVARAMQRTMSLVPSVVPMLYGIGDPFEFWQPTNVTGFVLDLNPKFQTTVVAGKVTQIVNNCPGHSEAFAISGSLQPSYEALGWVASYYKRPSILGNGSQYLLCSDATLATSLIGGTHTPCTLIVVKQYTSLTGGTGNYVSFCIGRSSAAQPIFDLFATSTTYACNKRSDANVLVGVGGGTSSTSISFVDVHHTGTATTIGVNGTDVLSAGAQSVGALTVDTLALFASSGGGIQANVITGRIARVLGFSADIGSTSMADIRSILTAAYL